MDVSTPEKKYDFKAGQVDLWPILRADPEALAAEVTKGDHDGYLSGLARLDLSQSPEGRGRLEVQGAIAKRIAKLEAVAPKKA